MRIFRNILAVILGWALGSCVNMGLIQLGHTYFPIEGLDVNDMEALVEAMKTFEPKHFLFPFLAHALGAFFGALIAGLVAANHKMKFAMAIGGLFLLGGIIVSFMLPAPIWFILTDILLAYIPMAFIAGKIALKFSKKQS